MTKIGNPHKAQHVARRGIINNKRVAFGGNDWNKGTQDLPLRGLLQVTEVEGKNKGTGKGKCGRHDIKMATVGQGSGFYNPKVLLANKILDALDPTKAPSKGRTLADMTPEEKEKLQARLGVKISGASR